MISYIKLSTFEHQNLSAHRLHLDSRGLHKLTGKVGKVTLEDGMCPLIMSPSSLYSVYGILLGG